MSAEQEAQQAQTIADKDYCYPFNLPIHLLENLITNPLEEYAVERIRRAESTVDSQAQKIAEQAEKITEIEADCVRYDEAIMIQGKNAGELRRKIAEQAKEPKLHCDICSRCKGDNFKSWCSINGKEIEDVLKCPPWCIERGDSKEVLE